MFVETVFAVLTQRVLTLLSGLTVNPVENNLIVPLAPLGALLEIILLESTVTQHSFTDS